MTLPVTTSPSGLLTAHCEAHRITFAAGDALALATLIHEHQRDEHCRVPGCEEPVRAELWSVCEVHADLLDRLREDAARGDFLDTDDLGEER